jgi:hypothetical protein
VRHIALSVDAVGRQSVVDVGYGYNTGAAVDVKVLQPEGIACSVPFLMVLANDF